MSKSLKLKLLLGFYITSIMLANFLGSKIWEISYPESLQNVLSFLDFFQFTVGNQLIVPISSESLSFSVGLFVFPLTFLITDIVEEVEGKSESQQFLQTGLSILIFSTIFTVFAVNLPPATRWDTLAFSDSSFTKPEAYDFIFSSSLRIMIASISAFGISQTFDIFLFRKLKKTTKGKYLWLRNNFSTISSQFLDTVIFYLIAFSKLPFAIPLLGIQAGSGLDFDFMLRLFIPYYIFKVIFSLLDTPFVYLGSKWLKNN